MGVGNGFILEGKGEVGLGAWPEMAIPLTTSTSSLEMLLSTQSGGPVITTGLMSSIRSQLEISTSQAAHQTVHGI